MHTPQVLWFILIIIAVIYWWVGKSFISQPNWNVPMIFHNRSIARTLVILPQLGFVIIIILGFTITEFGWWYLGAVVASIVFLTKKPQMF